MAGNQLRKSNPMSLIYVLAGITIGGGLLYHFLMKPVLTRRHMYEAEEDANFLYETEMKNRNK